MNVFKKNINLLIIILIGFIFNYVILSLYQSFTRFEVSEGISTSTKGQTETGESTVRTNTGTILNKQSVVLSGFGNTKDKIPTKNKTKEGIKPVLGSVYAGYEGDSEYERVRNQIIKLGVDYEIAEHITREAYANTSNPKLFVKNIIGASNSEGGVFQHGLYNNYLGVMECKERGMVNGKLQCLRYGLVHYTTVQESITKRRELYVKNHWENRTTAQDWLDGNYCTSACLSWVDNYNYIVNKLNI